MFIKKGNAIENFVNEEYGEESGVERAAVSVFSSVVLTCIA